MTIVYESERMVIEERPDGVLVANTDAGTREPVTRRTYAGWDERRVRARLAGDGVPAGLIDRMIRQMGFLRPVDGPYPGDPVMIAIHRRSLARGK